MNIKTYSFVKYIATLGALLLFLAPLLGFLEQWKLIFHSVTALAATVWVLELVGIILIIVYVYVREKLKNKSGYVYTKKDQTKLNWAYAMYGCEMVISFIYVFLTCGILGTQDHKTALMITFAPFYVAQFAVAILAAIFESMSRVQEQIYLYDQQEQNKDNKSVSKTGTKRTLEAQQLVDDQPKKKSSTKKATKHKDEVQIDDAQTLEDFFNEDDDKDNK